MEGRNQNWKKPRSNTTKRIEYLYGDTFSPKIWGIWGQSFLSKAWTRWFAPCVMEGSRQHPLSNWSLHPMVHYAVDSITGTKVFHELHVAGTFLLMAIGSGARGWGKVPHFVRFAFWIAQRMQCLLLKRCFVALCGYLLLSTTNCVTKEGFRGLSSWSSEQPSPLCSSSLSLRAASVYVDLLKNGAPPDMESIAPF